MKKSLLSVVAAASLFALPAFAQSTANQLSSDPEIRYWQEYRQLVDKANAYRIAHEHGSDAVTENGAGDVAAVKGTTATDAGQATQRIGTETPRYAGPRSAIGAGGHYNTIQDYWSDR